ncbi:PREDICTED: stigma-specific STIG1-like protein 2 [Ipomoea nil]|uniref:stigma-specific STIG1-like protein 2 n=1 Tax=Ipomoea nil TaxID=35883 RepID=UPI0009013C49|nr:PREDICTED: stigma-specific STIG1-like protein 2 [Ipomoea nil]
MKPIKLVIAIAITVVISTALTMNSLKDDNVDRDISEQKPPAATAAPSRRPSSRFLAEQKNPRAADHCKDDNEICYLVEGKNSTCCNNKCMDLGYDKHNCGACKKKCKFTDTCCRGECVNVAFDKRHCGECNNRCMPGGYCIYGLCDYA